MRNFDKQLIKKFKTKLIKNENMAKHTTFKIGGNAKYFINVSKISEISYIQNLCQKYNISYFVLGAGSNLLVLDEGYDGVIISMQNFNKIKILKNNCIQVDAGVKLGNLVQKCAKNCLSGIEWAVGIPGSVGGAITMNAGAFDNQISDYIEYITVLENGRKKLLKKENVFFDYRKSLFTNQKKYVIINAILKLNSALYDDIILRQHKYVEIRNETQAVKYPSAGSVFKRKPNITAAELIDKAGLKGLTVGGAMVSDVHSGYIVNTGNATAKDVLTLIKLIKEKILNLYGQELEKEIIILGE